MRVTSDRRAALEAVGLERLEPPPTPVDLADLGIGTFIALLQPLALPAQPAESAGPSASGGSSAQPPFVAIVREAAELPLLAEELESALAERAIPVRARCARALRHAASCRDAPCRALCVGADALTSHRPMRR